MWIKLISFLPTETLQYTCLTWEHLGATSGAKTGVLFLGPTRLFFHGGPYKAAGVYSNAMPSLQIHCLIHCELHTAVQIATPLLLRHYLSSAGGLFAMQLTCLSEIRCCYSSVALHSLLCKYSWFYKQLFVSSLALTRAVGSSAGTPVESWESFIQTSLYISFCLLVYLKYPLDIIRWRSWRYWDWWSKSGWPYGPSTFCVGPPSNLEVA